MRTESVKITYSRWLFYTHLSIIVAVGARYIASVTTGPAVHTLGTLSSLCLLLVFSYHIVFFVSLNYRPVWFEPTVVFHSPFAWAAIWLLVFHGEDHILVSTTEGTGNPLRRFVDRRVGPVVLLAMHIFVWYMRRTVIGVTVFERKIRASLLSYRCYRVYTALAAPLIVSAWRIHPYASIGWRAPFGTGIGEGGMFRELPGGVDRVAISRGRLIATMLVSGGTHVLWYSFISYAYQLVVWKEYLREGFATWIVGDVTMCTKLH
ncbi:hypothetical protein IW140_003333 [Coemansia sp. RSA 1813]|nr:hypothetical protein EV178_001828 [Coemansia sp. RSA 1646]KAJ1767604.1 hypothetical protein LPJ74_005281 [Coemansia sp. RSA 1843]KAJ2093005.1 hypothetical protein IW138_000719 [Coemansia sp. RSA 986]KAJ2214087.1 hypothetical protein EV179_003331 [Coemansia sp. RSA 487]KAJ2569113.1 hypothetical protein IW140_003333 [Coemansia sp. RSA 1813]